jgi:hypothetical protein
MPYVMNPTLRAALREALDAEPWDEGHKQELWENNYDAVPDGPIVDAKFDRIWEETGGEDPYIDAHVITAIEFWGLEHLAR